MPTPNNIKNQIKNKRIQLETEKKAYFLNTTAAKAEDIKNIEAEINEQIKSLHTLNDPKSLTQAMDDHYPVFLMPVRMEIRFMTIKHIARLNDTDPSNQGNEINVSDINSDRNSIPVINDTKELWVRLFPDDIHIQTHEPALTEEEIASAKAFWDNFKATDDESTEEEEIKIIKEGAWNKIRITYGPERAAWIIRQTKNENYSAGKQASWVETPHTKVLPDRFVIKLVDYDGNSTQFVGNPIKDKIDVSINPDDNSESINNDGAGLVFDDNLKWMTDFHEAEAIGLGIRVPLPDDFVYKHSDSEQVSGFKQILALGLNHSSDHLESKRIIEELLENHTFKIDGMDLMPQGTKTNNTKSPDDTYGRIDEDDLKYMDMALEKPQYDSTESDNVKKSDGQLLAEALGIEHEIISSLPQSGNTDVIEAMAMNRALWPSTIGYYLKTMMHPILSPSAIKKIRTHFEDHVFGRGLLPSVRIDDQPYGIHVTSSFKNWEFNAEDSSFNFKTYFKENVLDNMFTTWSESANSTDRIHAKHHKHDKSVDELKDIYLKILGHHASSVQFHQRTALGRVYLWNLRNLVNLVQGELEDDSLSDFDRNKHLKWMKDLSRIEPEIFDIVYTTEPQILNGPVVDTKPLSEKRTLENLTSKKNYMEWLKDAYYKDIFEEKFDGKNDVVAPTSLLYLLLRHSVLLSYEDTSSEYADSQNIFVQHHFEGQDAIKRSISDSEDFKEVTGVIRQQEKTKFRAIFEQESRQILSRQDISESEFESRLSSMIAEKEMANESVLQESVKNIEKIYASSKAINTDEFLHSEIEFEGEQKKVYTVLDSLLSKNHDNVRQLKKVKEALDILKDVPTARLERCLAEHLDIGAYRLDAWYTSLANERIKDLRSNEEHAKGLYFGSYSWLLDAKPGSLPGIHYEEVVINKNSLNFADSNLKKVFKTPDSSATPEFIPSGTQRIIEENTVENLIVGTKLPIEDLTPTDQDPNYVYLGESETSDELDIGFDSVNDKFIVTPREDDNNQGYIHAPSITQAMAASVLRAAYNARRDEDENAFAINLKSKRVQKALQLLEGLSNGQELSGLLGMQFERLSKEKTASSGFDINLMQFIYEFKKAYPYSGQLVTHKDVKPQKNDGAFNIVNGLDLLEDYNEDKINWSGLGITDAGIQNEFKKILDNLSDNLDAVYDLMMAESVYQNMLGNQAKSTAALDVLNGNGTYQSPEVVRTQRHYKTVTHKVGIQFDPSANPQQWNGPTPRSIVEPGLNQYLARVFPDPSKIMYRIVENGTEENAADPNQDPLNFGFLNIEPIDFYYFVTETNQKGDFYGLSQFLIHQFIKLHGDSIDYTNLFVKYEFDVNNDEFTLDQLLPFLNELKDMIGQSKTLGSTEFLLSSQAYTIDANDSLVISSGNSSGWQLDDLYNRLKSIVPIFDLAFSFDISTEFEESSWTTAQEDKTIMLFSKIEEWVMLGIPIHFTPVNLLDLMAETDSEKRQEVINYIKRLYLTLIKISNKKKSMIANLERELAHNADPNLPNYRSAVDIAVSYAQAIFGKSFKVFPKFKLFDKTEFENAHSHDQYIRDDNNALLEAEQVLDDWFISVSRTKEKIGSLRRAMLFTDNEIYQPKVTQLPFKETLENGDAYNPEWLGIEYNIDTDEIDNENLSLIFDYPDNFDASNEMSGLIIDEWVEEIPLKDVNTGIGVHYDGPNSEPPQACLIVVSPNVTGSWSWDDIMSSLSETLDMAAVRLVDPDKIDETSYAQTLPMLMPALTGSKTMPVLDLKKNIILDRKPGDSRLVQLGLYNSLSTIATIDHSFTKFSFDSDLLNFND